MTSWYSWPAARGWTCPPWPGEAHAFHRSLPGYSPAPLVSVPEFATELGVSSPGACASGADVLASAVLRLAGQR